jgi:hypothetical protein
MMTPRTLQTLHSKDGARWSQIQFVAVIYLAVIVCINWRTWIVTHGGARDSRQFRPQLFSALPALASLRMSAQIVDPTLFSQAMLATEFESEYKNPCWLPTRQQRDAQAPSLRCLPYFYVLTPFQSGVRDLAKKMQMHPDIARTDAQPHFWSELRATDQYLDSLQSAVSDVQREPKRKVIGRASLTMYV